MWFGLQRFGQKTRIELSSLAAVVLLEIGGYCGLVGGACAFFWASVAAAGAAADAAFSAATGGGTPFFSSACLTAQSVSVAAFPTTSFVRSCLTSCLTARSACLVVL